MQQVIQISLSGHPAKFNLDAEAYDALRQYLDRARMNLKADPDQEEVMRDLEQSIGAKLADLVPSDDHVINLVDVPFISRWPLLCLWWQHTKNTLLFILLSGIVRR